MNSEKIKQGLIVYLKGHSLPVDLEIFFRTTPPDLKVGVIREALKSVGEPSDPGSCYDLAAELAEKFGFDLARPR